MSRRYDINIKERKSYKNRDRNRRKILYIHGFMSGANSYNVIRLINTFGHIYEILSPELNGDPHYSISLINSVIVNEKPVLIIGSSLGGFYALMCESNDIPIRLVNPCIDPYTHLQRYLDKELTYYSKREDGNTKYTLTLPVLERFKEYDVAKKTKSKIDNIFALLSSKDEVLGDSHYQFFKKIKEETNYPYHLFSIHHEFGHRLFPFGYIYLQSMVDNVLEDIRYDDYKRKEIKR